MTLFVEISPFKGVAKRISEIVQRVQLGLGLCICLCLSVSDCFCLSLSFTVSLSLFDEASYVQFFDLSKDVSNLAQNETITLIF